MRRCSSLRRGVLELLKLVKSCLSLGTFIASFLFPFPFPFPFPPSIISPSQGTPVHVCTPSSHSATLGRDAALKQSTPLLPCSQPRESCSHSLLPFPLGHKRFVRCTKWRSSVIIGAHSKKPTGDVHDECDRSTQLRIVLQGLSIHLG